VCHAEIKVFRTIILPVVLYGWETWSLTLREERRLRVLRRIFGLNRDEVTGEWRTLHNEELSDLYSLTNTVRDEMSGACSTYGGEERCIQGFGGETCGKETTWKTRA
jgi:hypothetical protein